MTRVRVALGEGVYRVEAEGHATGEPAACAGVSALLYALAGWLRNAGTDCSVRLAPGSARIAFSGGAAARAAAELTAVGLAQIAKRYPGAVEIEAGG